MTEVRHANHEVHDDVAPNAPTGVVGIGGSAGGVEALLRLVGSLAANDGVAYVVVLHLSPQHESNLAALLQSRTPTRALQVTDSVKIARDTIYVIPPHASLAMADSSLVLTERAEAPGRRQSIDLLFRTLAGSFGAVNGWRRVEWHRDRWRRRSAGDPARGGHDHRARARGSRIRRDAVARHRHGRRRLGATRRQDRAPPPHGRAGDAEPIHLGDRGPPTPSRCRTTSGSPLAAPREDRAGSHNVQAAVAAAPARKKHPATRDGDIRPIHQPSDGTSRRSIAASQGPPDQRHRVFS